LKCKTKIGRWALQCGVGVMLAGWIWVAPLGAQNVPEPANWLHNSDFARNESNWNLPAEHIQSTFIDVPANAGVPNNFKRALRLQLSPQAGEQPYAIAMRQPIEAKIAKGQPLVLRVWARSPQNVRVGVHVEEKDAPYEKSLSQILTLSPQWKEYEIRGESKADFAMESANLVLHLGHDAGTIELTGLRLFDPTGKAELPVRSTAAPDKPETIIANGDFSQPLAGNWSWGESKPDAPLQATLIPAEVAGFKQALRLNVTPPPGAQPWNVQLSQKTTLPIARDDAIYVRAWLRSPDRIRTTFVFEEGQEPHAKSISYQARLTPEWKEYRFVGTARRGFAPGEAFFKFFLGLDKGVVEMAGVRVENYGKAPLSMFNETIDYFGGATVDDTWRQPAQQRIEKIRKGDLKVRVIDAQGRAVPNAKIHVEQKKHFFRFGTAGPASRLLDDSPDSQRFRTEVKKLFNTFVFENDLKWTNSEQPGRLEQIDKAIAWLQANGVDQIRGHNIVWGSNKFLPERMHNASKEDAIAMLKERIQKVTPRYSGKLYVWDVVNEAGSNTELWDKIGWENFVNVYKWVREADPQAKLAYNDYDLVQRPGSASYHKVLERIKYLVDNGAPFEIIGDQAHMGTPLTTMPKTLEVLDTLAKFGKRLEITEFDVGIRDDKMHAEYTRDFMTAVFSHPQVDAFLFWGFWEGAHWRAQEGGAMFRKDWSRRPTVDAYEDLVFKQWWTQADLQAAANGEANTRAFYGTHEISVTHNGQTTKQEVRLEPGQPAVVTLQLGG
jgi:endo-1,4-beta-xylanase